MKSEYIWWLKLYRYTYVDKQFFFLSQFSIFRHLAILKNLKHFRFSSSICFYIVDEIEFKYLLVYFNFENKSILLHCFQKAVAENLIKVDPPWIFHHIESIENIIFNGSIVNVKLIYIVVLAWILSYIMHQVRDQISIISILICCSCIVFFYFICRKIKLPLFRMPYY